MLKVNKLATKLKNIPRNAVNKNGNYKFSRSEAQLPAAPKSMFVVHLASVVGSTPAMIVGVVMTASSVAEWGVPLIAASVAGVSAPFVARSKKKRKYREELRQQVNAFLPQIALNEVPPLTMEQVTALDNGRSVEVPLAGGGSLRVSFDTLLEDIDALLFSKTGKSDTAGTLSIINPDNGIGGFDALVENLRATNPDIAQALNKASNQMMKTSVTGNRRLFLGNNLPKSTK